MEDDEFFVVKDLQDYLVNKRGLPDKLAEEVAETLHAGGYKYSTSFYGVTRDQLAPLFSESAPTLNRLMSYLEKATLPTQKRDATDTMYGPFHLLSHAKSEGTTRYYIPLDRVRTLDELKKKVSATLEGAKPHYVTLFGGNYNPITKKTDFVKLTSTDQLSKLGGGNEEPILLRYGAAGTRTPPSLPPQQREEMLSARGQGNVLFSFPVTFASQIPVFYEDPTFTKLVGLIQNPMKDNPALLLMAVPGAGKSRTVKEAAKEATTTYKREKFYTLHPFIVELRKIAKTSDAPTTYQDGKDLFTESCERFLDNTLKSWGCESTEGVSVYHFDEIQLLMGEFVVSKEQLSDNVFDYVMPSFGDAVDKILQTHHNVRIAFSGTNFFTELVFNSGSHLKVETVSLEGVFPLKWGEKVLKEKFDFESVEEGDRNALIEPLCSNRRAFHFLGRALEWDVSIGGTVTKATLSKAAATAYKEWSSPIARCTGSSRNNALSLLALITFPNAFKASMSGDKLSVPASELPYEIKKFALGGGVNMSYQEVPKVYEVSIPTGCTLRLLTQLCNKVTTGDNMKEYEAFRVASRSVQSEKGHFFERLVACELTFLASKLYKTLLSWTVVKDANPDPRSLGCNFLYAGKIFDADWGERKVFCVNEDLKAKGRVVDVGFPVFHGTNPAMWKVFCECKVVQDKNDLWKMCWRFFEEMKTRGVGEGDNCAIAVFLSFHEFLTHKPKQKQTTKKENTSAHESRLKVLDLIEKKREYFAVVDATELNQAETVLPLVDLYAVIDRKEPTDVGVTELERGVGQIYYSESQLALATKQPEQKKMKIQ